MTAPALVLALLEMAGNPSDPGVRRRIEVLAYVAFREAGHVEPPLDPILLGAIAFMESGFSMGKVGAAGELGAWQIKPDGLAKYVCRGVNIRTLRGNARCAVRILASARAKCGGDPERWLGRYQGHRTCRTTNYARRVMGMIRR